MGKINSLVHRADDCIAIRQRSNFHAAIDTAREHPADLVDLDLRDSLAHVLEETAVLVLAGIEEERSAHRCGERPDLDWMEIEIDWIS